MRLKRGDEAVMGFPRRPGADQPVELFDVEGRQAGFAEQAPRFGRLEPGQMHGFEKRRFPIGLLDLLAAVRAEVVAGSEKRR